MQTIKTLAIGGMLPLLVQRVTRRGGTKHVSAALTSTSVVPTPPPRKIKIGLCQILVGADKQRNIENARKVIIC